MQINNNRRIYAKRIDLQINYDVDLISFVPYSNQQFSKQSVID